MVGGKPHPVEIATRSHHGAEVAEGVPRRFCRVKVPESSVDVVHDKAHITHEPVQIHVLSGFHPTGLECVREQAHDFAREPTLSAHADQENLT